MGARNARSAIHFGVQTGCNRLTMIGIIPFDGGSIRIGALSAGVDHSAAPDPPESQRRERERHAEAGATPTANAVQWLLPFKFGRRCGSRCRLDDVAYRASGKPSTRSATIFRWISECLPRSCWRVSGRSDPASVDLRSHRPGILVVLDSLI